MIRHGSMLMAGTLVGALCNAGFHMAVGRTLPNAEYGSLVAMLGIILAVGTPTLALQNTLAHFASSLAQAGRRNEIRPLVQAMLIERPELWVTLVSRLLVWVKV